MAHVHLIAHPRKLEQDRSLRADDTGGSSGITEQVCVRVYTEPLIKLLNGELDTS